MKKCLAAMLAFAMLFALAACGKTEEPAPTPGKSSGSPAAEKEAWREFDITTVTDTRSVVAENNCTVTVSSVNFQEENMVYTVTFTNPTDMEIRLNLRGIAVNGLMVDQDLDITAAPGATHSDDMVLSVNDLRQSGIFELAVIDLWFDLMAINGSFYEQIHTTLNASNQDYTVSPNAFTDVFTSPEAQEELQYQAWPADLAQKDLGEGVYINGLVYFEEDGEKWLAAEVVNDNDAACYLELDITGVNGLEAHIGGGECILMPQTRHVFRLDLGYVSAPFMEAFGIKQISKLDLQTEIYSANDGLIFDYSACQNAALSITIPETKSSLNANATQVYKENGLKISYKAPVTTGSGDTLVYLIFQSDKYDFYVANNAQETAGGAQYRGFEDPGRIDGGDQLIACLELEGGKAESVTVSLMITEYSGSDIRETVVDLTLEF